MWFNASVDFLGIVPMSGDKSNVALTVCSWDVATWNISGCGLRPCVT